MISISGHSPGLQSKTTALIQLRVAFDAATGIPGADCLLKLFRQV